MPFNSNKNPLLKSFDDEILDVKKQSLYARLKKLFSTDVIVRNVGGKQLKIKDTDNIMYATDRNSLRDRFNRIRSTAYNAYTRDFSLSYQAARMDLFRDYDCVGPDTIIPLPDGSRPTIAELAEKYKDKPQERFWVYSYDHETNSIKLGKAYHPRKKGGGTRMGYKVTFDNGQYVIGSIKHPFLMRDGTYKRILELEVGDSVMPFYQKDFRGNGYRNIYNFSKGWQPEHKIVAEQFNRPLSDDECVHHKGFNPSCNLPENLQIMTKKDHLEYHRKIMCEMWSPENKPKTLEKMFNSDGYKNRVCHKWNGERQGVNNPFYGKIHTDESNEKRSKTLVKVFKNRNQNGEKNPKYRDDLTIEVLRIKAEEYYKSNGKLTLWELIKNIGCDYSTFQNRLKTQNQTWNTFKNKIISTINHKIESIECIGPLEVYDVTVEEYHNFATDSCIISNTMDMDPIISSALDIYSDECVHGDTIIPLLNGEKIRIEDLYNQNRKDFWVYSLDSAGNFVPEKCERVALNGKKQMYKIVLDDGTEIKCTSNHQWVKSDGNVITTAELHVGTSLSANNHRVVSVEFDGIYNAYDLVNVGNTTHLYAIETKDGSKLFTHNCLTYNEMGKMLTVNCENNNVKRILENLYNDILNIPFNMWSWTRNMVKYGDFYLKLYITPEYGIYMVEPISAYNVERIENADPYNKRYVKFQIRPTDTTQAEVLENYEVAHFRLMSDSNFLPYGKGMIEGARRVWKQLSLMEDAMLISRIMRAPERRIFYTDIGNIPPAEVETFMEKMIGKMKKVPYMDEISGEYNLRFNLQNMVEDYYIPVRGSDSGTKIDTLPGMEWTGIDDLEYLKNKMMAALKIPKAFLGFEEGISGKCVSGNTKIRLLDGRNVKIADIAKWFEYGKVNPHQLQVYSYDKSLNTIVPGEIVECKKTRLNAEMIRVHLDNNTFIDTTPDHKFILTGGEEIIAKNLKSGDSLQAVYIRKKNMRSTTNDYEQVWLPNYSKWEWTHKIVDRYYNGNIINNGTDKYRFVYNHMPLAISNRGFINNINTLRKNHKVVNIEYLTQREDTYNLEVWDKNENHNYLIENGIVIKNSTLASEDVRFARTIQRIQKILENELEKIGIVHLYAQGYRDKSLVDFKLELTNPSTIFEKEKIEIWTDKVSVATDMIDNKLFSYNWIYKNIFNMSEDDIKIVADEIVEDAKQRYRFTSIEEDGDDPAKPFKKIGGKDKGEDEEGEEGDLGDIGGKGGGGGLPDLKDLEKGGSEEGGPEGEPEGGPEKLKETKLERDQSGEHDARRDHPMTEDPLGDDAMNADEKKRSEGKKKSAITHNYEKGSPLRLEQRKPSVKPTYRVKNSNTDLISSLAGFLSKTQGDTKKELIKENNNPISKSLMDESNIISE